MEQDASVGIAHTPLDAFLITTGLSAACRMNRIQKRSNMVYILGAEAFAEVPRARGNPLAFLLGAHFAGSFCLL